MGACTSTNAARPHSPPAAGVSSDFTSRRRPRSSSRVASIKSAVVGRLIREKQNSTHVEDEPVRSARVGRPKGPPRPGSIRRDMFMHSNTTKITDLYSLSDKLGQGVFGSVFRAKHGASGSLRAVKVATAKNSEAMAQLRREVAIMKVADHPNVVRLYETFESSAAHGGVWMVMELCKGGALIDYIIEAGHFNEVDAATVMRDMFRAVGYLHGQGIMHRDLKPENFLLATKDPISKNVLKIIDFGLSNWIPTNGKPLTTRVGTPFYVAPEVLARSYGPQCDYWSAGAIMFVLLSGSPPFYSTNTKEIFAKVRHGKFSYSGAVWNRVSADAKFLIDNLLVMNPEDRYTPAQALNHTWINDSAPAAKQVNLKEGIMDKLCHFRSQNNLTKAVLQIIAGQLSDGKLQLLRDAFLSLDTDCDGLLNVAELKVALGKAGVDAEGFRFDNILDGFDADGSGEIDYTEFLAAFLDRNTVLREDRCRNAFSVLDLDGDGLLSSEELRKLSIGSQKGRELPSLLKQNSMKRCSELSQIMKKADLNGDGSVDFEEFMTMLESSAPVDKQPCFAYSQQESEDMITRYITGASSFGGSPPVNECR